jgi:hypothetical protein
MPDIVAPQLGSLGLASGFILLLNIRDRALLH